MTITVSREKLKNYVQYRRKLTGYTLHATIDRTLDNPDNAINAFSYSKNTLKVTNDDGRTYEVTINRGDVIKLNREYVISSFEKDDTNEDYAQYNIKNYNGGNAGTIKTYKNGDPDKNIDKTKILSKFSTDSSNNTKNVHSFDYYSSGNIQPVTIETPKNGFQSKYDTSKVIKTATKVDNITDYNIYNFVTYDNNTTYTIKTTKNVYNFMNYKSTYYTDIYLSNDDSGLLNYYYNVNNRSSKYDPSSTRLVYRKTRGGYSTFLTRDVAAIYKDSVSSSYSVNKILGNNGIDTDIIDYYYYDKTSNETSAITLNKLSVDSSGKDTYGDTIGNIIISKKGMNNNFWRTINNLELNIEQSSTKNIGKLYSGDNILIIKNYYSTVKVLDKINKNSTETHIHQNIDKTASQFIGETYYYDKTDKTSLSIKATLKNGLDDSWMYLNLYVTDLSSDNIFNKESGKEIKINTDNISINMTRYAAPYK